MISTITTSTIAIVSSGAVVGSLALIGMGVLLALLIQKEVITLAPDSEVRQFSRALNIAIVPLLLAFALLALSRLIEIVP